MKIRIDRADLVFSQYIRLRDGECRRCHSRVELNDKGLPVTHQNSHFFGRGRENTRFDPDNCDTVCFGCHRIWGSDDREGYSHFKIKQLGKRRYNMLNIRAETYCKKDRKLALIVAKKLLQDLKDEKPT